MPTVKFGEQSVECAEGANLRKVMLDAGWPLYNPPLQVVNCIGFGTCGTCAVKIEGEVSAPSTKERMRLAVPPHNSNSGLRLACQCTVQGDLVVTKYPGKWGQKTDAAPVVGAAHP